MAVLPVKTTAPRSEMEMFAIRHNRSIILFAQLRMASASMAVPPEIAYEMREMTSAPKAPCGLFSAAEASNVPEASWYK